MIQTDDFLFVLDAEIKQHSNFMEYNQFVADNTPHTADYVLDKIDYAKMIVESMHLGSYDTQKVR